MPAHKFPIGSLVILKNFPEEGTWRITAHTVSAIRNIPSYSAVADDGSTIEAVHETYLIPASNESNLIP